MENGNRISSRIFVALMLVTQSLLLTACFSYRATISLDGMLERPDSHAMFNEVIQRAGDAVARSVKRLGLIPDPDFERIARDSKESSEIDNVVVGLLRTRPGLELWIEVRSVVEKETGRFFVLIENRMSPFPSDLTDSIETAIISALQDEFPSRGIRSGEDVIGPALGP